MKVRKLFRITVIDENRLEERFSRTASPFRLWAVGIGVALGLMLLGAALLWLTPMRTLMPGYLPREQRLAVESAFLRIDSMRELLAKDRAYMESVMSALKPEKYPPAGPPPPPQESGTLSLEVDPGLLADSLLKPTEQEAHFGLAVRRREGFNLQVLAPLAAEGMEFCFPATSGVLTQTQSTNAALGVLIPRDASIVSVADGTVIGVTRSVRERGYIIWVQHDNGFLSRYSRLGTPLVDQGQRVEMGEAIALPAVGTGIGAERFDVLLWHDGEALDPRKYLKNGK